MAHASPVSAALHGAFESQLMPLLQELGFTRALPKAVKPGLVVAMAERPLAGGRRLDATLWCRGAAGDQLRFRLDRIEPGPPEVVHQIDLKVPWPDPSYPKPLSLGFSGEQLRPSESTAQLEKAIAFLGGALAASSEALAEAVPELAERLKAAAADGAWRAAAERAEALWLGRALRGETEDREVVATVVFVGAGSLTLEADGTRLTFKMDTAGFDRHGPVSVSGWVTTAAGTRLATRLMNGGKLWAFDARGEIAVTAPAGGSAPPCLT